MDGDRLRRSAEAPVSAIADPVVDGLARGWRVVDASTLSSAQTFEADVCIIGTGAGGGITAEILTQAGLDVILIEEGPLKSSRDFRMQEADAYPDLYQDSAARKTRDKSINILQGRCVGGSTTVNWTSSFRTPASTLAWWRDRLGIDDMRADTMQPWFEKVEQRLSIAPWHVPPNRNNALLTEGASKLGIASAVIRRNVSNCWNLGYCGMGCPVNAKQSMLVTTIPAALDGGAKLIVNAVALRLVRNGTRGETQPTHLEVVARIGSTGSSRFTASTGATHVVRARHFVLAAGAIGSPAVLLRSNAPDPYGVLGRRTFLHPTVISAAIMNEPVHADAGAPQSVYSDHYLGSLPIDGPLGFKLEAPPIHPVIFATTMAGYGSQHAMLMKQFSSTHVLLSLLRDGFHADSAGGRVMLQDDRWPVLDYPLTDVLFDGIRRAFLAMAEIQFAAGAREVIPVHEDARPYRTWSEAKRAIGSLRLKPLSARIVSAHVMGGCAMSVDPRHGVVDAAGRHHQWPEVSVIDGSLFPTSIGANPQLTIYALAARLSSKLAGELGGKA